MYVMERDVEEAIFKLRFKGGKELIRELIRGDFDR